jgi:DNA-binding MarR family transcriptional regulator
MAKKVVSSPDVLEVADRLHSAAIHLLRTVRKVDEASGLSAARLSALSVLVFGGPTTIGELARAEQVSAPTVSRLVAGLERDGLAVREADARDGRSVRVRATAKGRKILRRGRERRVQELAGLVQDLPPPDLQMLGRAATLIEDAIALPTSARGAYAEGTAERRWSDLEDGSTGSGGTGR